MPGNLWLAVKSSAAVVVRTWEQPPFQMREEADFSSPVSWLCGRAGALDQVKNSNAERAWSATDTYKEAMERNELQLSGRKVCIQGAREKQCWPVCLARWSGGFRRWDGDHKLIRLLSCLTLSLRVVAGDACSYWVPRLTEPEHILENLVAQELADFPATPPAARGGKPRVPARTGSPSLWKKDNYHAHYEAGPGLARNCIW